MVVVNQTGTSLYTVDGILQEQGTPWNTIIEKVETALEERNSSDWITPITNITTRSQEFKVGNYVEVNTESDAMRFAEEVTGSPFGVFLVEDGNKRFHFAQRPLIGAHFVTEKGKIVSGSISGVKFPDSSAEKFNEIVNSYSFFLEFRSSGAFLVFSKENKSMTEEPITAAFLMFVNSIFLGFSDDTLTNGAEVNDEAPVEITEITEEVQVVQLSSDYFTNLDGAEEFLQRTFGKSLARTWEPSRGAKRYYLPADVYAGYSFESNYRSRRVESGTYLGEVMPNGAERASLVLEAIEMWLESTPETGTTLHLKTKPCRTVEEDVTQNLINAINAVIPQPQQEEEEVIVMMEEEVSLEEVTLSEEEIERLESEGAVLAVCYTDNEEGLFTPQLSKHEYYFDFEGTPSVLEYYLAEGTLSGEGGFALLEEYHGGGAYREVVEIENIPTYIEEVFGGTHLTEEAYENMMALIAL